MSVGSFHKIVASFGCRAIRLLLFSMVLLTLVACKVELNTNLVETEANEMMARLLPKGINVVKVIEKDKVTLFVEQSQFGEAVDILASHGLPRRDFATIGEVFNSEGLVASPLQEWARFNFAKSQELSQSISSIPGVIKADVHIAESRQESPFKEPTPPSASVLIQMHADKIGDDLVPQIKQLISFSIPDIAYDKVGVIISPISTPDSSAELVAIWGLVMHPKSAAALQSIVMIGASVMIIAIALAIGVTVVWRRRRTKAPIS